MNRDHLQAISRAIAAQTGAGPARLPDPSQPTPAKLAPPSSTYDQPDGHGHFGVFGGRYVPETLMPALIELAQAYDEARRDSDFRRHYERLLHEYVGRPTPLTYAARLSQRYGFPIYLKREDLCHTGAHKINNALGQVLLAQRLGKRRVIAETGAGQHGVATATAAALLGLECEVFMGEEDMARQRLNVFRMRLLGAKVTPVLTGTRTLKDATNEAIRQWVTRVRDSHYVIGSVVGPDPYPRMVRDFQAVIGQEARQQIQAAAGRLPTVCLACVGGGSNSMGLFYPFVNDRPAVHFIGVEAAGRGLASGEHAASLTGGRPGVLHGAYSYLLQTAEGQIQPAYSISAGLDYPGVGPEHAYWREIGQAEYVSVTDEQALAATQELCQLEGILPALESAHALAYLPVLACRNPPPDGPVLVNLSGRGDKDVDTLMTQLGWAGAPSQSGAADRQTNTAEQEG